MTQLTDKYHYKYPGMPCLKLLIFPESVTEIFPPMASQRYNYQNAYPLITCPKKWEPCSTLRFKIVPGSILTSHINSQTRLPYLGILGEDTDSVNPNASIARAFVSLK